MQVIRCASVSIGLVEFVRRTIYVTWTYDRQGKGRCAKAAGATAQRINNDQTIPAGAVWAVRRTRTIGKTARCHANHKPLPCTGRRRMCLALKALPKPPLGNGCALAKMPTIGFAPTVYSQLKLRLMDRLVALSNQTAMGSFNM